MVDMTQIKQLCARVYIAYVGVYVRARQTFFDATRRALDLEQFLEPARGGAVLAAFVYIENELSWAAYAVAAAVILATDGAPNPLAAVAFFLTMSNFSYPMALALGRGILALLPAVGVLVRMIIFAGGEMSLANFEPPRVFDYVQGPPPRKPIVLPSSSDTESEEDYGK